MKITFQPQPEDLVAISRLGLRPRPWLIIVGGSLLVLLLAVTVFWTYQWFSTGSIDSGFLWALGAAAYFALIFFVLIPWRARKTYRQQKTLHTPVSVEFTEEAFVAEADNGHSRIAWSDFHKWKASDKVIALYHSDMICNFIPCRAFTDDADRQSALALIERKLGPQKA